MRVTINQFVKIHSTNSTGVKFETVSDYVQCYNVITPLVIFQSISPHISL